MSRKEKLYERLDELRAELLSRVTHEAWREACVGWSSEYLRRKGSRLWEGRRPVADEVAELEDVEEEVAALVEKLGEPPDPVLEALAEYVAAKRASPSVTARTRERRAPQKTTWARHTNRQRDAAKQLFWRLSAREPMAAEGEADAAGPGCE